MRAFFGGLFDRPDVHSGRFEGHFERRRPDQFPKTTEDGRCHSGDHQVPGTAIQSHKNSDDSYLYRGKFSELGQCARFLAVEFGTGAAREGRREDGEVVAGEWVLVNTVLVVDLEYWVQFVMALFFSFSFLLDLRLPFCLFDFVHLLFGC